MNESCGGFYEQYPLVRIFQYHERYFAFDGKSNLLTEITLEEIKILTDMSCENNFNKKSLGNYYDLISSGAFLPHQLKKIAPNKTERDEIIEYNLQNVVPRKFILEVTQNCTLKCKYCYFSEDNSNRKHVDTIMTRNIAKDAIDLYFRTYIDAIKDLSFEKKDKILKMAVPNLSWWGGEPFLNFELMKWSKQYFESLPWDEFGIDEKSLVYSVVSNFTVFNQEIMDFLADNNVYTFISLDGDKEQHDKNRVYAKGVGSFDIVRNNIDTLLRNYSEYSKKYVCIQSVKADNIDSHAAATYLAGNYENKVLKCQALRQTYWGETRKNEIEELYIENREYIEKLYDSLNNLSEKTFEEIVDKKKEYYEFFKDIFSLEEKLVLDNPKGTNFYARNFSCPIGIDAIFVDAEGLLHMCNKSDYSYPIGDVKQGVDKSTMMKLLESYHAEIEHNCKNCWAFGFCKICPATIMRNREFKIKGSEICKLTRMEVYERLYAYIILTHYPDLYDNARLYCQRKKEEKSFMSFEGVVYKNDY